MRVFTVNEVWGPFPCDHPGCKRDAFTLLLTDEEDQSLPEKTGPEAVRFIFKNKLGVATCEEHEKEDSEKFMPGTLSGYSQLFAQLQQSQKDLISELDRCIDGIPDQAIRQLALMQMILEFQEFRDRCHQSLVNLQLNSNDLTEGLRKQMIDRLGRRVIDSNRPST
jgi:hypothetical protein